MKKMFSLLMVGFLFSIKLISQTCQPLEDQRLGTTNNVSFANIALTDPSYPKIDFYGRLLYRGVGGNDLTWRYNGTNDGIVLHSANFNSYAPTLTGVGASGNWSINAATATNSTQWGGYPSNLNTASSGADLVGLTGIHTNGIVYRFDQANIKYWLGIPTGGETLQSVTDRGNSIGGDNMLPITFNRGSSGSYMGVGYMTNGALRWSNGFREGNDDFHIYNAIEGKSQLVLKTGGESYFNSGNVGIGTTSPGYKLDVNGHINTSAQLNISNAGGGITWPNAGSYGAINVMPGADMLFYAGTSTYVERMRILSNGNVGIGTNSPGPFKLAVEGTIGARKIKVTQETPWADYVFDSSYQLASLQQVEKFIQQNKHLPEVPSAAEVKKDGLDLGDNQVILLKKIEELTLYIIEQNKQVESQKQQLETQKQVNEVQKQTNTSLESRLIIIEKMLAKPKK
jgi:hypothetical protein